METWIPQKSFERRGILLRMRKKPNDDVSLPVSWSSSKWLGWYFNDASLHERPSSRRLPVDYSGKRSREHENLDFFESIMKDMIDELEVGYIIY